jgi:hypothetical protein
MRKIKLLFPLIIAENKRTIKDTSFPAAAVAFTTCNLKQNKYFSPILLINNAQKTFDIFSLSFV